MTAIIRSYTSRECNRKKPYILSDSDRLISNSLNKNSIKAMQPIESFTYEFDLTKQNGDAMCNFSVEFLVTGEFAIHKIEFYSNSILYDSYTVCTEDYKIQTLQVFRAVCQLPLTFWFQNEATPLYYDEFINARIIIHATGINYVTLKHHGLHYENNHIRSTIPYVQPIITHGDITIRSMQTDETLDELPPLICKSIKFNNADVSNLIITTSRAVIDTIKGIRFTYTHEGLCRDVLNYYDLQFNNYEISNNCIKLPNRFKHLSMIDLLIDKEPLTKTDIVNVSWEENNKIIIDQYNVTAPNRLSAVETKPLDEFVINDIYTR